MHFSDAEVRLLSLQTTSFYLQKKTNQMTNQIIQTFVESDMRVDLYEDGDAIITKDTLYFQLSADLIRSMASKARKTAQEAKTVQPMQRLAPALDGIDLGQQSASDQAAQDGTTAPVPRLRTTPSTISRQVAKTEHGWQAKFLNGQVIVTYFYESRSLARTGEVTDEIGVNGRIA